MAQRIRQLSLTSCFVLALGGCAGTALSPDALLPADVVLVGEQHDDAGHHRSERDLVRQLAARHRLAAVALEMAEQGHSTAGLPRDADPSTVRAALQWNEAAWPWDAYGPVVMAAVAAGVPVLGANLPRAGLRSAMADAALDDVLDPAATGAQREAIRQGHCDLLPADRLGPMVRVQVARDRAMARTLAAAAVPGRTVLLVAGAGHVDPQLGVPRHLPSSLLVRSQVLPATADRPAKDHCAELRQQLPARR